MQIDLATIEDDFESNWWQYIRVSSDFAFLNNVKNIHEFEVEDDDILIHKTMEEDADTNRRYVSKRYHQILEGEAFLIEGNDVRELMATNLTQFMLKSKKLPFGMEIEKVFQNKKVKVKFTLSEYDSFVLKIDSTPFNIPTEHSSPDFNDIEIYFKDLPEAESNPLQEGVGGTIRKLNATPTLEAVAAESGGKVFIKDALIETIEKRSSTFQQHETIFYILSVKDGKASAEGKKESLYREFDNVNVKCSENAMEKFALEVNDHIAFNGKLKKHRSFGWIIQNIRKFEKTP